MSHLTNPWRPSLPTPDRRQKWNSARYPRTVEEAVEIEDRKNRII
jgi:hypothetical protein